MNSTRPTLFLHLFSACALMAYTVLACTVTPADQTVPKEQLISRTKTIVLAEVVKAETIPSGWVKYTFKATRNLKGTTEPTFTIEGATPELGDPGTFNDHRDTAFWDGPRGRSVHDTDCHIHPSFTVGDTYLIFLDGGDHQKSFEKIEKATGAEKDKWLTWVEQAVK